MSGVKVNKKLRDYAKANGLRLVAFTVETPLGSTIGFEAAATVANAEKICKLVNKIIKLTEP